MRKISITNVRNRFFTLLAIVCLCSCQRDNGELIDSKPLDDLVANVMVTNKYNAGATESYVYEVWIILKSQNIKKRILQASRSEGFILNWVSDAELEICFSSAQISMYTNYFSWLERDPLELTYVDVKLTQVIDINDCNSK